MIETERLHLRNINKNHSEAIFEIWANPQVNKYLWEPSYNTVEEVRDIIPENYSGPNIALSIILKETKKIIGTCGVVPDDLANEWEIGYCLKPEYWGYGYATEVLNAFVELAKEDSVDALLAEVAVDNKKSLILLERNGFEFYKDSVLTKADFSQSFKSKIYRMIL